MKRYEGLFILNISGKEDGVKETIDKVSEEIAASGGKIETVQKMDKRPFARISSKRVTSGFYVNVIFQTRSTALRQLKSRFAQNEEVYRVIFVESPTASVAKGK